MGDRYLKTRKHWVKMFKKVLPKGIFGLFIYIFILLFIYNSINEQLILTDRNVVEGG